MLEIGFYKGTNSYLLAIGESFLRENIEGVIFTLVENEGLFNGDYLVVLDVEKEGISFSKLIVLTESIDQEGLFLYQKRDSLLKAILMVAKGEGWKSRGLEVMGGFSFDYPGPTSYFNYFISSILGSFQKKVCFLTFNPFFPHEKAYPINQNGGLSKLLHYLECNEKIDSSLLSYHHHYGFYYVEGPLNLADLDFFKATHITILKKALEKIDFQYLILDLYSMKASLHFLNLFKRIYYMSSLCLDEGDNGFLYLKAGLRETVLEQVPLKEDVLIEGMDQLLVQERSKSYHLWKKKLKRIF